MSTLEQLRSRLLQNRQHGQLGRNPGPSDKPSQADREDDDGNKTQEQNTWIGKIGEAGNSAKDWLEFTNHMRDTVVHNKSEELYSPYMSNLYNQALKAVNLEEHKYSEDYAQILINCANFKNAYYSTEVARSILNWGKDNLRKVAVIFVASAQLELCQGNTKKAKRILLKGEQSGAVPIEILNRANTNLVNNRPRLLEREGEEKYLVGLSSGKENESKGHQEQKSLPSHPTTTALKDSSNLLPKSSLGQLAQWGRVEGKGSTYTDVITSGPRVPTGNPPDETFKAHPSSIKPVSRLGSQSRTGSVDQSTPTADISMGTDSTISFRDRNLQRDSCSSDDADTQPLSLDTEQGQYKRSIRSYNSTPDCKGPGLLSISNNRKKTRVLGKAMRVPMDLTLNLEEDKEQKSYSSVFEGKEQAEQMEVHSPRKAGDTDSDSGVMIQPLDSHSNTDPMIRAMLSDSFLSSDPDSKLSTESKHSMFPPSSVDSGISTNMSKRGLVSFNSTPDCKEAGMFSFSNRKKLNLGKPMRVMRTSLPQLREGADDDPDDTDNFVLDRLPVTEVLNPAPDEARSSDEDKHETASRLHQTKEDYPNTSSSFVICNKMSSTHKTSSTVTSSSPVKLSSHKTSVSCEASSVNTSSVSSGTSTLSSMNSSSSANSSTLKATSLPQPNIVTTVSALPLPAAVAMVATPASLQMPMMMPAGAPVMTPGQPGTFSHMMPVQGMHPMSYVPTPHRQTEMLVVSNKTYMIRSMIGRGGSSKVYDTLDQDLNLRAVKCVNFDCADEATIRSYKNEISLLERLQHSNKIIKMYDFEFRDDIGMLYVVMERGDTDLASLFRQYTKSGGVDSVMQKFFWKEMLRAVQVLHKEGIVHSDLKPANFLLVAGNLKLIDFGIANAILQDMTSVTREQQVGTLNYISPEAIMDTQTSSQMDTQGRQKPRFKIGVKSDVWSLGCILYNLVYSRTPFHKIQNSLLKLQAIINPRHQIEYPDNVDSTLRAVLQKCLQRDPKDRPCIEELLAQPY